MPVQLQTVEIVFEGLQQKTDARSTVPGKLERADNVEFDKTGALNKRRGYQRVAVVDGFALSSAGLVSAVQVESTLMRLATCRDELLIFGMERVYAVGSRTGLIVDCGIVHRGTTLRGCAKILHVHTSSLSDEVGT